MMFEETEDRLVLSQLINVAWQRGQPSCMMRMNRTLRIKLRVPPNPAAILAGEASWRLGSRGTHPDCDAREPEAERNAANLMAGMNRKGKFQYKIAKPDQAHAGDQGSADGKNELGGKDVVARNTDLPKDPEPTRFNADHGEDESSRKGRENQADDREIEKADQIDPGQVVKPAGRSDGC